MKNNVWRFVSEKPLVALTVLAISLGLVAYMRTKKMEVEPQTQTQVISADEVAVKGLVLNFYKAIEDQDGQKLFGYMTKPSNTQEKSSYDWSTGADLKNDAFYRVFLRVKILNPRIDDVQKVDEDMFIVRVTDQVSEYSNAQDIGWNSPKPRYDILLTIVRIDGTWLIDKFRNPSDKVGTEKYSGFGQG